MVPQFLAFFVHALVIRTNGRIKHKHSAHFIHAYHRSLTEAPQILTRNVVGNALVAVFYNRIDLFATDPGAFRLFGDGKRNVIEQKITFAAREIRHKVRISIAFPLELALDNVGIANVLALRFRPDDRPEKVLFVAPRPHAVFLRSFAISNPVGNLIVAVDVAV